MNIDDVLEVWSWCSDAGVVIWLDGGWCVDALLGQQTRLHNDLDIVLRSEDLASFRRVMGDNGFRHLRDDGPFNFVLVDARRREVDVHLVDLRSTRPGSSGREVYGPHGLEYEIGSLDGTGVIGDVEVNCCTADFQVRSHTGYPLDEDDIHDVVALHQKFGVPLLPEHHTVNESRP